MKASVCISTRRRGGLEKQIRFFTEQTFPASEFELVIIDGLHWERGDQILSLLSQSNLNHYYGAPRDLGRKVCLDHASMRNDALARANGEMVLFFDDYQIPDKNLIQEHWNVYSQGYCCQGRQFYFSPLKFDKILNIEELNIIKSNNMDLGDVARPVPSWVFYTHNCSAPAKNILAVNGFDERYNNGCFLPGTKILTSDLQWKKIEEFVDSEKVINGFGMRSIIRKTHNHEHSGKIVSLNLMGEYENLECTPDHPILCCQKENFPLCKTIKNRIASSTDVDFIQAQRLKPGDFVLYPIPGSIDPRKVNICFYRFCSGYNVNKFPIKTKYKPQDFLVNEDFMRIAGYFLAEGNYGKNLKNHKSGIIFTFHIDENCYTGFIKDYFAKLGYKAWEHEKPLGNSRSLQIYQPYIAQLFSRLFGEYSHGKFIHPWFMDLSPTLQLSLVKAYFEGDGSLRINRQRIEACVKLTSRRLIDAIRLMLLRNRIDSTIVKSLPGKKGKKIIYSLYIYGRDNIKKLYGIEINRKQFHSRFFVGNYLFVPVVGVSEKEYNGKVYDLNLGGLHYVANGVAVHNTGGEDYNLGIRLGMVGSKTIYNPKAICYHMEHSGIGVYPRSPDTCDFIAAAGSKEKFLKLYPIVSEESISWVEWDNIGKYQGNHRRIELYKYPEGEQGMYGSSKFFTGNTSTETLETWHDQDTMFCKCKICGWEGIVDSIPLSEATVQNRRHFAPKEYFDLQGEKEKFNET